MTDLTPDKPSSDRVNDPAVGYLTAYGPYDQLTSILGHDLQIEGQMDMIRLSRSGVRRASLDRIALLLGVNMEQLSALLHISYRTILRKKKSDKLSVHVSEQVIAIAEVIRRGLEVFESEDKLRQWMQAALPGLNGQRPIDFLDTSFGASLILKKLGRIEHGVF